MTTVTGSKFSTVSSEKNERQCMSSVIRLYPLTNYSVQNNDYEDPPQIFDYKQSLKLRQQYENNGMIRTVQGVLLGHQNSIIHVLLLKNGVGQIQSSKLPEVTLYNSEDEIDGMKRLMAEVMGFKDTAEAVCQIQHVAAKWWRPNFEESIYPYIPSHITKPKEMIKVFVVELPKQTTFTIAKNNALVAAPVFEIYNNISNYGHIIASLPHVLGRFGKMIMMTFQNVSILDLTTSTIPEVGFNNKSSMSKKYVITRTVSN
ncbi:unnamed protein product [Brugia pahangi]|uniref:Cleavage and polyadenylation specificity factor subunit 5 n=1 Tax=Brugia pahangi TaxID=6280 RepID=A0A0N4TKR2_BRUPA|nr:unnamed protein product [Brugia pahangi]